MQLLCSMETVLYWGTPISSSRSHARYRGGVIIIKIKRRSCDWLLKLHIIRTRSPFLRSVSSPDDNDRGAKGSKKGRTGWKATYTGGEGEYPDGGDHVCTYAGTSMCEGGSGFIRAHRRAVDLNKSFSRDNPRRVCHFISCNFVLDAPRNVTYTCTCTCSRATRQRVLSLQGRQRQRCIETAQLILLRIVLNCCREKNRNARQREDSRRVISTFFLKKSIKTFNGHIIWIHNKFIFINL